MNKIIISLITAISFIALKTNALDTKAEQAIVVNFDTNEILFEKNSNTLVPPASMTKIMTVYVVFDRIVNSDLSINNQCRVSAKAYKMGGSRTFLEIDDYVTIDTLLRGIIIQSGNDASVALAECLSGTEEDFAKLMNVYAKKLNLKNTNFINSSGWPEKNHYSTVYDIALVSNALIKDFPNLYYYFSEKDFSYNGIKQPNRNQLLKKIDGVDGLKTGFTRKSGWGISTSTIRNNRRITVVINGANSSRSRVNETTNLINWAYNQTIQKKIVEKNQFIKNVDVWLGTEPSVNLIASHELISTVSFDQLQLLKSKIEYTKPLTAPIVKNQEYGKLIIDIKGKPKQFISLIADKNVKKVNVLFRTIAAIKYLIFGTSLDEKE